MKSVAIFKFGVASAQLTIAQADGGHVELNQHRVGTHVGELLSGDVALGSQRLRESATQLLTVLGEYSSPVIRRSYATANLAQHRDLLQELTTLEGLGPVQPLSGEQKARLFYQSIGNDIDREHDVLLGIGKKNALLGWWDGDIKAFSLQLGANAFRKIQKRTDLIDTDTLGSVCCLARTTLRKAIANTYQLRPRLIFGPSRMATFLRQVNQHLGLGTGASIEPKNLARFFEEFLLGKPYESLAKLFPQDPTFMLRADKVILSALEVSSLFNCEVIVGTDLSWTSAVARRYALSP